MKDIRAAVETEIFPFGMWDSHPSGYANHVDHCVEIIQRLIDAANAPTRSPEPAKRYGEIALCAHILAFIEFYLDSPVAIVRPDDAPVLACVACGTTMTAGQVDRICEAANSGDAVLPATKGEPTK